MQKYMQFYCIYFLLFTCFFHKFIYIFIYIKKFMNKIVIECTVIISERDNKCRDAYSIRLSNFDTVA